MQACASHSICNHTHTTGIRCGSPALRGEQFCFYHHPTRRPPQRTTSRDTAFEVPPLVDREEVQIALSEILRRLADNTLDSKRAGLLLQTVELAVANLSASGSFRSIDGDQSGLLADSASR